MASRADTALKPAPVHVCVCVATFRRPELLRTTLDSVVGQRFERCAVDDLRVIVVDNDAAQEGRAVVAAAREVSPWPIEYFVEEIPGISYARNRLVAAAAGADYIAMIDDDERADPGWLDALLATATATGAEAVLGPVVPEFDVTPPEWMRPFFSRRRHATPTQVTVDEFRTSNLLVSTKALRDVDGPFDPAFALTGGEDTLLGRHLERSGARFYWADDAVVRERFSRARTRISWILERHFRVALNLSAIRLRTMPAAEASAAILVGAAGATALGGAQIAASVLGGRRRLLSGATNLATAAGNIAGLFGISYRGYGAGRRECTPRDASPQKRSRA